MSLSLDLQYAGMISGRVRNYKRTNSGWNFSCPYCGDSSTNKSKARGYLYRKPNSLFYTCFNCNTSAHDLHSLIACVDNNLAEQYKVDKFLEGKRERPTQQPTVTQPKYTKNIDDALQKVSSLPPFHKAKKYVVERQIPSDKHYLLYYTPNWKRFAQSIDAEAYQKFDPIKHEDEPRLVIPLIAAQGKIAGYQGRALSGDEVVKYMTILTHEDNPKLFGVDRVDKNIMVNVFEGPLDSLFIENSISTCGGTIETAVEQFDKERLTVIYDNEPRNPHTIRKVERAIAKGFKVCIWPTTIDETDVNQMVLSGQAPSKIQQLIKQNTFEGLKATLELKKWRKL